LIPIAVLRGFFMGGLSISFFEGLLSIAPADHRPSYAALQTATANLAFFVGPFLGSLLAEYLNIQIALGIAGILSMVGALLCWRLNVGARVSRRAQPVEGKSQHGSQPHQT
jgi:MFS family permease